MTDIFERCYVPKPALSAGVAKLAYAADSKSSANGDSTTSKTYRNLLENIVQTHDWRGFFANVPTENG